MLQCNECVTALSIKLGVISDLITLVILATIVSSFPQLILPVQSQNVTKNRTDHRMHVEGPQICQIIHWNNSFQNIYGINRGQLAV